jgi:hypothetical protein
MVFKFIDIVIVMVFLRFICCYRYLLILTVRYSTTSRTNYSCAIDNSLDDFLLCPPLTESRGKSRQHRVYSVPGFLSSLRLGAATPFGSKGGDSPACGGGGGGPNSDTRSGTLCTLLYSLYGRQ